MLFKDAFAAPQRPFAVPSNVVSSVICGSGCPHLAFGRVLPEGEGETQPLTFRNAITAIDAFAKRIFAEPRQSFWSGLIAGVE